MYLNISNYKLYETLNQSNNQYYDMSDIYSSKTCLVLKLSKNFSDFFNNFLFSPNWVHLNLMKFKSPIN